jgi:hypothetical protein
MKTPITAWRHLRKACRRDPSTTPSGECLREFPGGRCSFIHRRKPRSPQEDEVQEDEVIEAQVLALLWQA